MQIYNNKSWNLNQIKEVWFKLEKDMQKLTEDNMENIFWLEFIKTEFQLNNLRIDSLAFDVENNSFVIIEYKRWSSYSVVDQWMSYLSLMLHNKADFVQELSRKRKKFIDTKHIEWSGSRVIIIADAFTRHQKESINFKDFPIELYELKQFSNDVVVFNPIKASHTSESIKTVTRLGTEEFKEVNKEIVTYNEEFHTDGRSEKVLELFEKLKNYIFEIDKDIEISYKKMYIAFKLNNKNIISIKLFVNSVNIYLHCKYWILEDEYNLCRNVRDIWTNAWNAENEIKLSSDEDLYKAMDLIKQAYKLLK